MAEADNNQQKGTEDVESLKARLTELENQKNTWMGKATDYEKRFKGVDPDEFHANRTALEQLQRDKAIADPKQMDEWKTNTEKQIRTALQKELDEAVSKAKNLEGEIRELRVVDRVFKDVAGQFNDDCFDDIKGYIRRFCDLDENGEIVVKDEKGNVRYAPGSASKKMNSADFGEWLGQSKPSWRKPTHVKGTESGGSTRSTGSNGAMTAQKFMSLDPAEQRKVSLAMKPEELHAIGREVQQFLMGR